MKTTFALLFSTLLALPLVAGEWKPLLRGDALEGWDQTRPGKQGWVLADGVLTLEDPGAGDLVSKDAFGDFELEFEWKVAKGANSGVKYRLTQPDGKRWLGLEYQVLDDANHPNGRNPKTSVASLYDVQAPAADKPMKPVGEWNQARVVSVGKRIEHWLNGAKVLEMEIGSAAWKEAVGKSKFRKVENFGDVEKGHLLIQDHGDVVSFRNMRIRSK